jgi:hypothetical protein
VSRTRSQSCARRCDERPVRRCQLTRVYVPATLGLLARWQAAGSLDASAGAHAVTAALREWYVSGDAEELEYAALLEAAEHSLHLLAEQPGAVPRRVVVAADVDDAGVHPGSGARSAVAIGDVPFASVVSVHVDDAAAEGDVVAAVAALPAATAGDDDARYTVDSADAHDLLWYDVQEIRSLLA